MKSEEDPSCNRIRDLGCFLFHQMFILVKHEKKKIISGDNQEMMHGNRSFHSLSRKQLFAERSGLSHDLHLQISLQKYNNNISRGTFNV